MHVEIESDDYSLIFEVAIDRDSFSHEFGRERFTTYNAISITQVLDCDGKLVSLPFAEKAKLFNRYADEAAQKAQAQIEGIFL